MQKIDQQKLSAFQVEASETPTSDIYARSTISKLEDHIVDLCQLSVDASHAGLQYLCERLRKNIHDHFITVTNISNDELALMSEWKSLVKAYLINNDNQEVVTALATNLSKSAWMYPLKPDDTNEITSILLGKRCNLEATVNDNLEFENSSLEENIQEQSTDSDQIFVAGTNSYLDKIEISEEELLGVDQAVSNSIVDELFVADDSIDESEYKEEFNQDELEVVSRLETTVSDNTEFENSSLEENIQENSIDSDQFFVADANSDIDKVEVPREELLGVDQAVSDSIIDELFVADESVDVDESSYNEELNRDQPEVASNVESIVETHAGVMADETCSDNVKALDKEPIQEPKKPVFIHKLEPVDSILLKYSD